MIETQLTNAMVLAGEPMLASHYKTGVTSYSDMIDEAKRIMIQDIINAKYVVRKLCKRLELQASATKTANFTGSQSTIDYAQRTRLVVVVSAVTASNGTATFTLKGSNTEDGAESTYTTVTNLSSTSATTFTTTFSDLYKYYRLDLTLGTATSITYSAYLIEEIYTTLHLYLTRAIVFNQLAGKGEEFTRKHDLYMVKYYDLIEKGLMVYDSDDDEAIAESETENEGEVRFRL